MPDKYKHYFEAWGYADDCAGITGATGPNGEELSEYEEPNVWFEMKLKGKVIGECMMEYSRGGWTFKFRSNTHELEAGKFLRDWRGAPFERDEEDDEE